MSTDPTDGRAARPGKAAESSDNADASENAQSSGSALPSGSTTGVNSGGESGGSDAIQSGNAAEASGNGDPIRNTMPGSNTGSSDGPASSRRADLSGSTDPSTNAESSGGASGYPVQSAAEGHGGGESVTSAHRVRDDASGQRDEGMSDSRGSVGAGSSRVGGTVRGWVPAVLVVVLLGVALGMLAVVGGRSLPERVGPPVEELAVEQVRLSPGVIELTVRNAGPDPVQVAQVFVNDAFVDVRGGAEAIDPRGSAVLALDYPWQDGQPYLVSMLTSSGLVIEHEIGAAVQTPTGGRDLYAVMALLGTYVGVIPVVLGMLLLPVLRRVGGTGVRFLLAVTVGLLVFLVVDATFEGFELGDRSGTTFGGVSLLALGAILAFLALTIIDRVLTNRPAPAGPQPSPASAGTPRSGNAAGRGPADLAAPTGPAPVGAASSTGATTPHSAGNAVDATDSSDAGSKVAQEQSSQRSGARLALLIAVGIGLHNLGEGLAIGSAYAIGELALGAGLVIGFALHNTTEGLAIVSPLIAHARPSLARLLGLGLLAGAPAILGAIVGASINNAELSLLLLGLGIGAIIQVIAQIVPALRAKTRSSTTTFGALDATALTGIAVGILAMYATGLLILA